MLDDNWNPRYRSFKDNNGLIWDGCISDNQLWIMDNGDIDSVNAILRDNLMNDLKHLVVDLVGEEKHLGLIHKIDKNFNQRHIY